MTIWKLGCNWGSGNPSFYEFIKGQKIVIGHSSKLYANGDLIVITKGHRVFALAKLLDSPKPVITNPNLQTPFQQLKIDYSQNVNYAPAEWYELIKEEQFDYELQQGICRVNNSTVRTRSSQIWEDRNINYWIFQGNPSVFDFERAIRNNLLEDWTVSAHRDKIKIGDKVILWLTGKKAGCYALAKITAEPREIDTSKDDHLWKTEDRNKLKAGILITRNLIDHPLLWYQIKDVEGLTDLKVGNQGTNFSASKREYTILSDLIENKLGLMSNIDLSINTILYGPPGTGKTFKLGEYKESYFTDKDIAKSKEEVLREKVSLYPFWKVLGAVLGTSGKSLTVNEIVDHPIVKARVNPANKTKPNNMAWADLQSYANDQSTQLAAKYRRSIKLFHKAADGKWSIDEDKKAELPDIIDQALLDLAAKPDVQPEPGTNFKKRYDFITFHQKYSYEDFIEGIKPLLQNEEDGEETVSDLQFELKKGIFYQTSLAALKLVGYNSFEECYNDSKANREAKFDAVKDQKQSQYALFIDEINRANISAVFGELITLLEDDKRIGEENELWVELPYSGEKFCVPPNLYVVGTMNTADRSIALIDIALRRRFEFRPLYPEYTDGEWWSPLLEKLNSAIYGLKPNPDFFIGHAFFINKGESQRSLILNRKIIPLLNEYFQNNANQVKKVLADAGISLKHTGIKENYQIIAE